MEHPSNNIDDLLRARLENAALPPPAFVWPNVERALRRRKRRAVLWLLAAGLAGAGIVALWSRPGTDRVLAAPAGTAVAPAPAAKQAPVASVDTPAETFTPAETLAPTEAPAPAETAAPSGTTGPAATRHIRERVPAQVNGAVPAARPRPAGVQPSSKGLVTDSPITTAPLEPTTAAVPRAEQASAEQTAPRPIPAETDLLAQTQSLGATVALPGPGYLPIRLAALEEPERQNPPMPASATPAIKKRAPKKCYDFHSNRQAWLIDAYVGPSFIRKSLHTNDPEFRDYLADRQRTEHHELAFHGGIRASYLFAENFIVRTGLHYDQFTEKFEYIDPNFIKYTVEVTQKFINGQWVSTLDTVDFQYGSNYVKTYNRFGMLDIPLQAALELRSGITGVSLNLGGSVNVLFWKRGSMLGLDSKPVEFTPKEHQFDVFKPRLGLSLLGSIQWFIHAGPKTRIFAEPYYRHLLEPVNQAGYPVKQSYGVGGIRFGVTRIVDVK